MRIITRTEGNINRSFTYIKHTQPWEIGTRIHLRDKQTRKNRKIILESHTYGSLQSMWGTTTINYLINPKLPCRSILALRGGYLANNAIVTTSLNEGKTVIAQDGTVLYRDYFTNSYLRGGYVGISNLVIFSAVTKNSVKRGSVFQSKAVNELYADILYANTTFDPIIDSNGKHAIVANAPGSFQTTPIGARIGVIRSRENIGSSCTKMEIGYRPGIKGKGLYFNLGVSIAIIK